MIPINHFLGCTADYPEKPEGEPAQFIVVIDIGDNELVLTCSDCGAFVIIDGALATEECGPSDYPIGDIYREDREARKKAN